MPDSHLIDRPVPEHVLVRHMLWHVLGLDFFSQKEEKNWAENKPFLANFFLLFVSEQRASFCSALRLGH